MKLATRDEFAFAPRLRLLKNFRAQNFLDNFRSLALRVADLAARADTFTLADGTSVTGDIVAFNDGGITFRTADDSYTNVHVDEIFAGRAQATGQNPKIKPLVEPFIETPASERRPKPEIKIQDVTRLELPPKQSLFGALSSSSVGLFALLLIYAANMYAGFEIAVVRARPIGLVMGVAAVLPILGPIIFLCAARCRSKPAPVGEHSSRSSRRSPCRAGLTGAEASPQARAESMSPAADGAGSRAPETQVFQRGQFTFNRRFFETKFSGFFGMVRRRAEKDLVLVVKTGARRVRGRAHHPHCRQRSAFRGRAGRRRGRKSWCRSPTSRKSNSNTKTLEIPHDTHVWRARFGQGHAWKNSRRDSGFLPLQLRRGVPQFESRKRRSGKFLWNTPAAASWCRTSRPSNCGSDTRMASRPAGASIPRPTRSCWTASRAMCIRRKCSMIFSTSLPFFTCAAQISKTSSRACNAARSRTTAWTTRTWRSSARA